MRVLLGKPGVRPDAVGEEGVTPLHLAAHANSVSMVGRTGAERRTRGESRGRGGGRKAMGKRRREAGADWGAAVAWRGRLLLRLAADVEAVRKLIFCLSKQMAWWAGTSRVHNGCPNVLARAMEL